MSETEGDDALMLRRISPFEFARRFRHAVIKHETRLVWMLGAGCSVDSGIGDAGTIAMRWLGELKHLETGDDSNLIAWARTRFAGFDPDEPAAHYGAVLDALFYTEQDRQRELERLVASAEPGFGYATLAQMAAHEGWGERCNTVLTTNFDDLAADALYLYSRRKPQVLTHESFGRRARVTTLRPTIIKIHGDAHLGIDRESGNRPLLDKDVKDRLRAQLTESGLVFVGYGGRDDSVLDLLEGLPQGAPAGGVYWVNKEAPAPPLARWLEAHGAVWTPYSDFDALMYLLRGEFGLGPPQTDRFDQILKRYHEQLGSLERREELDQEPPQRPARPLREAASRPPARETRAATGWGGSTPDSVVAHAVKAMAARGETAQAAARQAEVDPPQPRTAPRRWIPRIASTTDVAPAAAKPPAPAPIPPDLPDPQWLLPPEEAAEGDRRYRAALAEHPTHAGLMARYARFLSTGRRDYESAEHYFNRAVDAAPDDAGTLLSFANFLFRIRKDYRRAEDCYRATLRLRLEDPAALRDFADFLTEARGDLDAAEDCWRMAAQLRPRDPETLRRYALFLRDRRRNDDAALAMLKGAAAIEPMDPMAIIAHGQMLARQRGDYTAAAAAFERAAEHAPAQALTAHAAMLAELQRDIEGAARLYEQAMERAPYCVDTGLPYAAFLLHRKNDPAAAERRYLHMIEHCPGDPRPLYTYARFLETVRRDADAARDCYRRASQSAPRDAEALARYACFLHRTDGEIEGAEARLDRALSLEPRNPVVLRLYGQFMARRGMAEKAGALLHRAVQVAPADPDALCDLADYLAEHGKADEAEQLYRQARAVAPWRTETLARYASFLSVARGDLEGAETLYRRALDAEPEDALALAGTARTQLLRGDRDKGIAMLHRAFHAALSQDPERRDWTLMLGLWLLRYAFDAEKRNEALKAAVALTRTGARLGAAQTEAVLSRAIDDGHPEPDILRELIRLATGESQAEPGADILG